MAGSRFAHGARFMPVPHRPPQRDIHLHLHFERPKLDYYSMLNLNVHADQIACGPNVRSGVPMAPRRIADNNWQEMNQVIPNN